MGISSKTGSVNDESADEGKEALKCAFYTMISSYVCYCELSAFSLPPAGGKTSLADV